MKSAAQKEPGKDVPKRGKYVYCIIRDSKSRKFGPMGMGGEGGEVHSIVYKDLAAVISDVPLQIYDPTRENVLCHESVNETVMKKFSVIPMSFGTIFRTEEDILQLLKSTYETLQDVLAKMEDKIEFGLKVLMDRDRALKEIEEGNEQIRRLKEEITKGEGQSTYFARMQLGRLVEAALTERIDGYVRDIFGELRDVAVASRSNKPIGEKMILNAAFLVGRDQEQAFDKHVHAVANKYEGHLTFKYTGPWPPYNFVNIRLKLDVAGKK